MRDWTKLLPASYNGVPFKVDGEEMSGGRRQAIHMVAGEQPPVIEEIGPGVTTFSVTGYLVDDLADAQAHALAAALMMPGPGFLILPIDGPQLVHVPDNGFSRSRSKDRNGFIAYDMSFILASPAGGYSLGLADVGFAFRAGIGGAMVQFGGMF